MIAAGRVMSLVAVALAFVVGGCTANVADVSDAATTTPGSGGASASSGGAPGATGGAVGSGGAGAARGSGGATLGGAGGRTGAGGGAATGSGGASGTGGAGGGGAGARGTGGAGTGGGAGARGTGGAGTGGGAAGGGPAPTGGSSGGGACQAAACGTHKWACWPMPSPASAGLPNPARYTDLGDGSVRDDVTCLEWEKTPDRTQGLWQANYDRCAALAIGGHDDWRLPTRIELASIVDFTRNSPAAENATAFPSAPSGYHRTASDWYETITGQNTSTFAWIYNMGSGLTSNAYSKTTGQAIARCVRGNGAGEAQNEFAKEPANHYTIAAGEVTDNYTGLVWQQGDSSQPSGAAVMPWESAAATCTALALGGHAWRVPTINELATLVDEARVGPAINRTAFPNTRYGSYSNNWYWASAKYLGSSYGWAINFDDGFTGYNSGTATGRNGGPDWNYFTGAWVRCVR